MIIITGAGGFIGSALVRKLNEEGRVDLVLVDDFSSPLKKENLSGKAYLSLVNRDDFFSWAKEQSAKIEFIFHLGARTDTTELDTELLDRLNTRYSKEIWNFSAQHSIPLIYASSAATYGMGEMGYSDAISPGLLSPLNPYGKSKNDFDAWVLEQALRPPFWAGFKFFNVYGPNEYHKGKMASVVLHGFTQIQKEGVLFLFSSLHPDYSDGEQLRDFVYVKDVVDVLFWAFRERRVSGIYNLGTGKARTFFDLGRSVFSALGLDPQIRFVPMPEELRARYQYFTEADLSRLRASGYTRNFTSLEDGVRDYVQNYLRSRSFY